jgi:hypothetical protein
MRKRHPLKNISPSTGPHDEKMQTEPAELAWKQRWIAERRRRRGIFSASPREWIFRLLGCSASCGLLFIAWSLFTLHFGPLRVLKGASISGTHKLDLARVAKSDRDPQSHFDVSQNVAETVLPTENNLDPPFVPNTTESANKIGNGISVQSQQSGAQSIQAILADEASENIPVDFLPVDHPASTVVSRNIAGDARVQEAGDAHPLPAAIPWNCRGTRTRHVPIYRMPP